MKKSYKINYENLKTLEDVVGVLALLNITITFENNELHPIVKNLLIEVNENE